MSDTMKSCWIVTRGHNAVFEFRSVPVPEPGAGEIVVRVRATAMNRGELMVGGVVHGGPEKIGGTEAAGEVHAVGEGVTAVKAGDRVMGRARGGFAEYTVMDARQAMPVPPHFSWEQAAAVPVAFLTSYEMLFEHGRLQRGEWLLVTGASSGVGVASIQCAKAMGAQVIGTSGSQDKLAALKAAGLDAGIATRAPDFAAKVKEITGGKGADLIVNCVGGSVFPECMRALAYQGRLATVGYVDRVMKSEIDLEALHANRYVVFGVSNAKLSPAQRAQTVRGFVRDVLPAMAEGRIKPLISKVFSFDDLPAAKDYMESNAQVGKVAVRIA
ncbi:MAG TPA: zinc-binding dehydrogenase [Burkholderiales bacterium]|nr:zinc-binding dehydrogenase [Burkholderiales bacterium]